MAENFTLIPAIDFSLYTSPETKPQFLSDLRNAVVQVGFFYLKNHGISEPVQSQLVAQTVNFFDLPVEEKQRIAIANSKHFLGYTGFTTRANGTIDHRETFTVRLQRQCVANLMKAHTLQPIQLGIDQPAPGPDEPMYRNLRGPNPVSISFRHT
jgi:isopenicillin N synthase-like dioxygenase